MGEGNVSRTRETTAWDRDGAAGGMGTLLLTLKAMVTPRAMATTIVRRTERETGGSGAPETPNGATCPATGDPQEVAGPGPTRAVCLSDSVCAVSRGSHLRWRCGITRPSTRPLLRHAERLAGPRSREGVCNGRFPKAAQRPLPTKVQSGQERWCSAHIVAHLTSLELEPIFDTTEGWPTSMSLQ